MSKTFTTNRIHPVLTIAVLGLLAGCAGDQAETDADSFAVQTQAARSPHQVIAVYFVGSDVPDSQIQADWAPRLQTALELSRTFYADQLALNGYDDRTFYTYSGDDGRPSVQFVRGSHPHITYMDPRRGTDAIRRDLRGRFEPRDTLIVVSPGITPDSRRDLGYYDAHDLSAVENSTDEQLTALCGDQGPLASGQLGGFAHELGHALKLRDGLGETSIMNSGVGTNGFGRHFVSCGALDGVEASTLTSFSARRLDRHKAFAGLPDLSISQVDVSTRIQQRGRINTNTKVCNTGNVKSKRFYLALHLSDTAPAVTDEPNKSKRVKPLSPGQCKTVGMDLLGIDLETLPTQLWVVADAGDRIFETNEDDNLSAPIVIDAD